MTLPDFSPGWGGHFPSCPAWALTDNQPSAWLLCSARGQAWGAKLSDFRTITDLWMPEGRCLALGSQMKP